MISMATRPSSTTYKNESRSPSRNTVVPASHWTRSGDLRDLVQLARVQALREGKVQEPRPGHIVVH